MRYLLLLKRLMRKKSYILMLLLVPLMVFLLKEVGKGDEGILTIGVYIPGTDVSSATLRESLTDSEVVKYISYDSKEALIDAVANKTLTEGWIVPEDLDGLINEAASNSIPSTKIQVVMRENGLTHLLGREIAASRVYPLVAKQLLINYMSLKVYEGTPSEAQLASLEKSYDSLSLSKSLFVPGYLDDSNVKDSGIILMPLRGILALWLMVCGIATSMYYLEDQSKGLFLWWKTNLTFLRDLGYYGIAFLTPTIITVVSLIYSGSFTSLAREIPALLLYEFTVIMLAMLLRILLKNIRTLGMLTPALIILTGILSPVFIDFKQARVIQKYCPAFHYLSSIHDFYYLYTLLIYAVLLGGLVVLCLKLPIKVGKVFKANLL